uniref:Transcriptional regulator, TetR family n=1 Tax=Marinomonas sp. (strain MWYL1) TaxID=400668 RepID=A6VZD0_MARMS
MRYKSTHKAEVGPKLLEAVGRGFRRAGFSGIGVDGLAKEAGVTSGAFYGHFESKDAAFSAAAVAGLDTLREAIDHLQATYKDIWAATFIDFYLSERLTCELGESCGLQSMTPDVMRASDATKAKYEQSLMNVANSVARGLIGNTKAKRLQMAWGLLAILSGGVTLARSVEDEKTRQVIADNLKRSALTMIGNTE